MLLGLVESQACFAGAGVDCISHGINVSPADSRTAVYTAESIACVALLLSTAHLLLYLYQWHCAKDQTASQDTGIFEFTTLREIEADEPNSPYSKLSIKAKQQDGDIAGDDDGGPESPL